MKKTIYHGSDHIIEVPIFHGGKPHNDYGYGFYCTESRAMAKEWAVSEEHDGYANCYEIDLEGLQILNLNRTCKAGQIVAGNSVYLVILFLSDLSG